MLSAAVIGLGQAGSSFDEEPRPVTWSHAGAYLAVADRYQLAGGAGINKDNRNRFAARCPHAAVFAHGAEMVAEVKPDVVSVCTPPAGRADVVEGLLAAHRPKGLICEKPLHSFFANAGIYVLDPDVIDRIPEGQLYEMTTLFEDIIESEHTTAVFPIYEHWLDVGRMDDLDQANKEFPEAFK